MDWEICYKMKYFIRLAHKTEYLSFTHQYTHLLCRP